jgi:hypothetical protein
LSLAGCRAATAPVDSPAISLDTAAGDRKSTIVVTGVLADDLARLRDATLTRDQWSAVLRVSVADGQPAMIGDYVVERDRVRFTPIFALDAGRQYRVVFDRSQIPGADQSAAPPPVVATVGLPASDAQPTTVVAHVYPSTDVIPENQLRMYIHFSAPMGIKGGLDYIRLIDAKGETVVDPFLPLDAEFWNDDRTRYTVFFDPGRQKRGITPNQQMGRALVPGQRYTLVVDREWRDGQGLPLKDSFRREFTAGPADERPLDTVVWRIQPPAVGTRDALEVTFPEALDHGLLLRALGIERASAEPVHGEVVVDEHETRWRFSPRDPWRAGRYQLVAFAMLEDLAGNRIGRAFEVDQFDRADPTSEPQRTVIPFTID